MFPYLTWDAGKRQKITRFDFECQSLRAKLSRFQTSPPKKSGPFQPVSLDLRPFAVRLSRYITTDNSSRPHAVVAVLSLFFGCIEVLVAAIGCCPHCEISRPILFFDASAVRVV